MPLSKIYIHLVFSTKNRHPYLKNKELRKTLFDHIQENALTKKIIIEAINGYDDHVHILLKLIPTQQLSYLVQLIKGESSRWLNKNSMTVPAFDWQDEYFAASVSESHFSKVVTYIENQERHHQSESFTAEYFKLTEIK